MKDKKLRTPFFLAILILLILLVIIITKVVSL